MLCGGISYEARTDLVFFEWGGVNAQRYLENVLEHHVVSFAPFIGEDFILIQDYACPHVARFVTEYLDAVSIQRLR